MVVEDHRQDMASTISRLCLPLNISLVSSTIVVSEFGGSYDTEVASSVTTRRKSPNVSAWSFTAHFHLLPRNVAKYFLLSLKMRFVRFSLHIKWYFSKEVFLHQIDRHKKQKEETWEISLEDCKSLLPSSFLYIRGKKRRVLHHERRDEFV